MGHHRRSVGCRHPSPTSGVTKLPKGNQAFKIISASWPEARHELRERLQKWRNAGYNFKLEWFLRCVTTVTTSEAYFTALAHEDIPTIQDGRSPHTGEWDRREDGRWRHTARGRVAQVLERQGHAKLWLRGDVNNLDWNSVLGHDKPHPSTGALARIEVAGVNARFGTKRAASPNIDPRIDAYIDIDRREVERLIRLVYHLNFDPNVSGSSRRLLGNLYRSAVWVLHLVRVKPP